MDDKTDIANRVIDHLHSIDQIAAALEEANLPADTIAYTVSSKDYDDIRGYLTGTSGISDGFQDKTAVAGNFLFYNSVLVIKHPKTLSTEPKGVGAV